MLNEQQYKEARRKVDANYEAVTAYLKANKTNGIPADISATFPFADEVDNALRSEVETYEFLTEKPHKAFVYVNKGDVNNDGARVTTWTGQTLGNAYLGRKYRDNFGGTRQSITVYALNGAVYFGTYYCSAGDYARITLSKKSKEEALRKQNQN